jgi:hypothetical protein
MGFPNAFELGVVEQYLISCQIILPDEWGVWQLVYMSGVVRCGYHSVSVDGAPFCADDVRMRILKHFAG